MAKVRDGDFDWHQNTACRYFPCHDTVPVEEFNCLFCYCPLMFIECDGNYTLMENGFKDCSNCTRNHDKDSWKFIVSRIRKVMDVKVKFSRIDAIGQNGNDGEHYD